MSAKDTPLDVVAVLVHRIEVIESLMEAPKDECGLVAELDIARSTIDRATWELEEFDLIEYALDGLRLTEIGRQVGRKYGTFEERIEGLVAAAELLVLLDADIDIDPAALVGAEVVFPGDVAPFSTGDRLLELLRDTTHLRNLSKGHVLPESPDVVHRKLLQNEMTCKTVFQADVLDYLRSEYPNDMEAIAAHEDCMYATIDSVPFALLLLEKDDDIQHCIQVFNDERRFGGLIINDTEKAIEWGERIYNRYLQRSERADQ